MIRIDGKGFSRFTKIHEFMKPNDINGLSIMNKAAECVMEKFEEIFLSYG